MYSQVAIDRKMYPEFLRQLLSLTAGLFIEIWINKILFIEIWINKYLLGNIKELHKTW